MPAAAEDLLPRAAHAQRRRRALPRVQGDPARVRPAHRPHLRFRQLRRPAVWRPPGQVQRPDYHAAGGLQGHLLPRGPRDQDEAAARVL